MSWQDKRNAHLDDLQNIKDKEETHLRSQGVENLPTKDNSIDNGLVNSNNGSQKSVV